MDTAPPSIAVVVVYEERYTSKGCGRMNNPGSSKSYKCEFCGLEADRDES